MTAINVFKSAFGGRKHFGVIKPEHYSYRRGTEVGGPSAVQVALVADVLDAVQTTVSALTDGRGGRYVASISNATSTAASSFPLKRIVVTAKPLSDPALKVWEAAAVMCGFTVHEIGHTKYPSFDSHAITERRWPGDKTAGVVANVLADILLESCLHRDFPGVAPSLRPALRWVAVSQSLAARQQRWAKMPLTERVNFMIVSTRYAPYARWIADEPTRAERGFWQAWATEFALDDPTTFERGIEVALDRLRKPEFPEPTSEPVTTEEEPPPSEDEDDDEDEDEPGPGKVNPGGDDDDGSLDPTIDDDESDEPWGEEPGDDEDDDDDDEPGEGDEPRDPLDEGEGESDDEGEPGTTTGAGHDAGDDADGSAIDERDSTPDDDDDLDEDEVLDGLDDVNQPDATDARLGPKVEKERSTLKVASSGGHGTMRVSIEEGA